MKLFIRLYRMHDMDLLMLYKNRTFNFRKALKHALHAYIEKKPLFFYPPNSVENLCDFEFKSSYRITITLDDEKDADIIEFMNTIKPHMRNATVKMILRGCIVGPLAYAMSIDDVDRQDLEKTIIPYIIQNFNLTKPPLRGRKTYKESLLSLFENTETKETKEENKIKKEKTKKEKKKKEKVENNMDNVFVINGTNDKTSVKSTNTDVHADKKISINDFETNDDFDFFDDLSSLSKM